MNNNMNFDPMTGTPIQNNTQPNTPINEQSIENKNINQDNTQIKIENNIINDVLPNIKEKSSADIPSEVQIQNELQNIATVEQDKQDFINKVQNSNQEIKEEKKEQINFTFIIILFVVILVSIYFLFPILLKHI